VGIRLSGGGPAGDQSYDAGSLVARTVLAAGEQSVEIADFMPWDGTSPPGRIVRLVTALRGPATLRLDVGRGPAVDRSVFSEGIAANGVVVRAGVALDEPIVLDSGDRLVLTIDDGRAAPLSPDRAAASLARTSTAWRRVAAPGDVPPDAMTSVLVLRALSWGDTGALVSAPTTSLPQVPGDERNYDGRFVRTIDVARWANLAGELGLQELASDAVSWLELVLEAGLPVPEVLAVDGNPPAGERVTAWRGWRRSEPVRLGLDPPEQPSVDVAAALLMAASGPAGAPLAGQWDRVVAVTDWLAEQPPSLTGRRALARMAELAWARQPLDLDAAGWHASRQAAEREMVGWGPLLPGTPSVDVLAAAWLGPWPAGDPVVSASIDEVRRHQGVGPWLAPEPPAASVVATLRYVRALAALERWDDAHAALEACTDLAGPLGLLPECVDPTSGQARGNRPSATAHLAYLEALLALRKKP
jgi:hypothetical protein